MCMFDTHVLPTVETELADAAEVRESAEEQPREERRVAGAHQGQQEQLVARKVVVVVFVVCVCVFVW